MMAEQVPIEIQIELEVRATYEREPGALSHVLKVVRESGAQIRAHLVYGLYDKAVAFLVCTRPSEAALALQQEGIDVETETVVTVRTHDRPGLLRHLVQTLEAERIDISYSYASAQAGPILLVIRTNDNPKAEDVLRNYLIPAAGDPPPTIGSGWPENRSS